MKPIFRSWFAYFGIVWLQEWLGILGACLLCIAMVVTVVGKMPNAVPAVAGFGFTGVALIVFVPALMGGAALRYASSRSMLFLRPHGRVRMIVTATLVITTLAALIVLPLLAISLLYQHAGTLPRRPLMSPAELFALCWSGIVLAWICVFVITSTPALSFLFMFLPLLLTSISRHFALERPEPLTALAFGVAAWGAFALWYMKVGRISPPRWYGDRSNQNMEGTPLAACMTWLAWSRGPMQQPRAICQMMLGVPSPLRSGIALAGWMLLIMGFMYVANPRSRPMLTEVPGFSIMMAAMMGGTMAYNAARRSRMLWLRAGMDRAALFATAERYGLISTITSIGILIGVTVAAALSRKPELSTEFLTFSLASLAVGLSAFYGGLALTRGWNVQEVLLCIVLFALFFFQMIFARPAAGNAFNSVTGGLILFATVALLRPYARRGWLKLDWRVAKMQRPFASR